MIAVGAVGLQNASEAVGGGRQGTRGCKLVALARLVAARVMWCRQAVVQVGPQLQVASGSNAQQARKRKGKNRKSRSDSSELLERELVSSKKEVASSKKKRK